MGGATTPEFSDWFEAYGTAWQTGNTGTTTLLLSGDARADETPFEEPVVWRDAIRRYWVEARGML